MTDPAAVALQQRDRALQLVDGAWHRLHPATPLLRGGLVLIAVGAFVFNSFRDALVNLFVPDGYGFDEGFDPVQRALEEGTLLWFLLAALGVIAVLVVGFWLTWRVHRFRITGDVVEVQQGLLFRKHRRAPIARIQGINVVKPWFARLFGACKFEVQSAGSDANVDLNYLSSSVADALRFEILGRVAGRTQQREDGLAQAHGVAGVARDFLHPDAEIEHLAANSLVRIKPGVLIASSLLDTALPTLFWIGVPAASLLIFVREPLLLFTLIPAAIGAAAYVARTLGKRLRYSIAQTPDGIRLSYGLASTTTEVLPAGRIFAMSVSQPLLWRPFGWWKITFTRAGKRTDPSSGDASQPNLLLPVGSLRDVETVISLVLPELAASDLLRLGITGSGDRGFVISPPRARWFRWFSRRRNGLAITSDAFLLRKGAVWRSLRIVPLARTQSFAMQQGPIAGAFGLADVVVHVVGTSFDASLGAMDAADVQRAFEHARSVVPDAIGNDSAERRHVLDAPDADAVAADSGGAPGRAVLPPPNPADRIPDPASARAAAARSAASAPSVLPPNPADLTDEPGRA